MRAIDSDGANLGIISTEKALNIAKEKDLDLIEVASKASPPVVKIMDFGKYQYQKEKEARKAKKKIKEVGVKGLRARINISPHDLELKAKKADEFLSKGDHIRFELMLRGREKGIKREIINEKLEYILNAIKTPHTITDGPKKGPRGLIITLSPDQNAKNKQSNTKTNQSDKDRQNLKTPTKTKSL